jgi:hypothetical protein
MKVRSEVDPNKYNCLAICKTGVEEIHYAGLLTTKTAKTAKRLFFAVFAVQLFQPG